MDRKAKLAQNNGKNKKWFSIAIDVFLVILLLISIIHIAYLTFAKLNPYGLNSDLVNEITYRQESFEQKTFFPKGFTHSAEALSSRPVLVYWLFYGITKNFLLSYQLENMTMLICQLAAMYFLLNQLSTSLTGKLFSLSMFVIWQQIGVSVSCSSVLFWPHDAYSVFATFFLLTVGLYLKLFRYSLDGAKKTKIILLLVLTGGIAVYSGLSSPRLLFVLYIPIFLVEFFAFLFKYIRRDILTKRDKFFFMLTLSLVVLNGGCYWLLLQTHRADFSGMTPVIRPVSEWFNWSDLSRYFSFALNALGIAGSGSIKSSSGLIFILHACFAFLLVIAILYEVKIKKEKDLETVFLLRIFVVSGLFVLLYMIITGHGAYRFFFPISILIPVFCGKALGDWAVVEKSGGGLPLAASSMGLACLLLLNLRLTLLNYSMAPSDLVKVSEWLRENDYSYVTASYWNAGVIKGYINGGIETQHSTDYTERNGIIDLLPHKWLIDTRKFEEERLGEPTILLLTDAEEKTIFDQKNGVYWMLETEGTKVKEIGGFNLYELHENPYTLLPKVEARRQEEIAENPTISVFDYPGEQGVLYENAVLDASGKLVSNGDPGILLQVSHSDLEEGVYEIILHYKVRSYKGKEKAVLDFSLGDSEYRSTSIRTHAIAAKLENVTVKEGQILLVRVWIPSGMEIEIESVEYRTPNK